MKEIEEPLNEKENDVNLSQILIKEEESPDIVRMSSVTDISKEEEEDLYPVYINYPELNDKEENNLINTRKYTWYNFFPKMLLVEFSRLANSYFLIIAVLQTIKKISYSYGIPLILIPLTFVTCLDGVKDLYEDYKRKESDDKENNSICKIFNSKKNKFENKKWYTIKIGDIVKIFKDQQIPADLLLLKTSDESGFCYIETKNIDGETNLKNKQSNAVFKKKIKTKKNLSKLKYVCITKPPNEFIYAFDATLYKIDNNGKIEDPNNFILMDNKSFLLRGCTLRQTEYIIGVAVYVGENTKTMINAPKVKSKHSHVEKIMNKQIIMAFIIQLILSTIAALIFVILYEKNFKILKPYIYIIENKDEIENLIYQFFKLVGTWLLVLSNIVPISLLITIETIKFFQSWVIGWDIQIWDKTKTYGCKVQTSTLNEELGQIKYIFTDKTGTLTKNQMNFKMMSIGVDVYGSFDSNNLNNIILKDKYGKITNVDFNDADNKFEKDKDDENKKEAINHFMLNLCLCNSVIIDRKLFENSKNIEYQASSPDEMALVSFARSQNYIFLNRTFDDMIELEINNEKINFKILNILEYSSERKRMSIICQNKYGEIYHYMKGADVMIEKLLTKESKKSYELEKTKQYLTDYSNHGLRTLMLAFKRLSKEEYDSWNDKYEDVKKNPNHKEQEILNLYDEIEKNFIISGSTAIEDQLQDNVNDTIHSFVSIGIKVWMLTGDKFETAKNIAYSCKLFQDNMKIFEIKETKEKKELKNKLKMIINDINKNLQKDKINLYKYGLIVGGNELEEIFSSSKILRYFRDLCLKCTSVICCRASPKQKAQLVKMIKELDDSVTLAIGDGANDVGMITEANVGIGIQGKEGTQAARASDYVISEFSHIKKLLLFHGREYYRRNSWVIGYNFYKNMVYSSPIFWAGTITQFSGVTIFDPFLLQLYNPLFVALPCGYYGIYSLQYPQEELVNNPHYYIQGMEGKCFNMGKFLKFLGCGFFEGFVIHLLGNYWFDKGNSDGGADDFYSVGISILASIIVVSNLRITLQTEYHEFYSTLITSLSTLSYFLVVFLMSNNYVLYKGIVRQFLILDSWKEVILDIKFWLYLLLSSVICVFIEICSDKLPILFSGEDIFEYYSYKKRKDDFKNFNIMNFNEEENIIKENEDIKEKIDEDKEMIITKKNMI